MRMHRFNIAMLCTLALAGCGTGREQIDKPPNGVLANVDG